MKLYLQMATSTTTNVCIMFPNNSTAVILGQSTVSDLHPTAFFIPEKGSHEQAAFTCYQEILIVSKALGVTVTKISDYKDLIGYHYIIFPNLDVNPRKPRVDFGNMCHNMFM